MNKNPILLNQSILTNKIFSRFTHLRHGLGHGLKLASFALFAFFGLAPFILSAATIEDLNFNLINDDTEYAVFAKDTSIAGAIEIPATYNGKPVTTIGNNAFYYCTSLTSITLPGSITIIGENAFNGCTSLTSINLPNSITSIGAAAFAECSSLTSLTLPDTLTSISNYTFYKCESLTSLTLPDGITSIGPYAFSICSSLTSINLPDALTSIEDGGFNGCSSVTSITLPDSITFIGEYAFNYCLSLTSIDLPDALTFIGKHAFKECTSFTSIDLPDSITSIGEGAFRSCTSLTSITMPDTLTSIGANTFNSCTSLTSIDLPQRLTSIGNRAFETCENLASMTFLGEAPSLGSSALYHTGRNTGLVVTAYDIYQDGFATWPDLSFLISLNIIGAPVVVTSFTTEASYDLNHNSFSIISRDEASGATVFLQHTESLHEAWATLESSDYTETEDSDAGTVTRSVTLDPETKLQGYYRLITE